MIICGVLAGMLAAIAYGLWRGDPRLIADEPDWMRALDEELSQKGR